MNIKKLSLSLSLTILGLAGGIFVWNTWPELISQTTFTSIYSHFTEIANSDEKHNHKHDDSLTDDHEHHHDDDNSTHEHSQNPVPLDQTEHAHSHDIHDHHHDHDHEHNEDHDDNFLTMSKEQIENCGVSFQKAGPGELEIRLSTRGKIVLHPDYLAHILPKVSGIAKEANRNVGDYVKVGDILATFESSEIADIKANHLTALEKAKLARSLFEREERLFQKKISPEQDYLTARSAYEEAKINIQLTQQKLQAFGIDTKEIADLANQNHPDLRLYAIRSPIEGTIINRHITQGEHIENTATIYEIADLKRLWVEVGIYPKDLSKVKKGQVIHVSLPTENQAGEILSSPALVFYFSPIIEEETITAKAIAELVNVHGKWRPGTFVNVSIATEKVPVPIVIPTEAIQNIEGKDCVFIKTDEGFEKRVVKTSRSDNEKTEIIYGLNAGEEYAAIKTFLLKAQIGKNSVEHEH